MAKSAHKKGFSLSIAGKISTMLVLFSALPLLGLLAFIYKEDYAARELKGTTLPVYAKATINTIERNLFERYGDVQAFTLNPNAVNPIYWKNQATDNALVQAMNDYTRTYGIYQLMLLVSPSGEVLAVNNKNAVGNGVDTAGFYTKNYANSPWFKKAVKGEFLEGRNGLTGTVVMDPDRFEELKAVQGGDGYGMVFAAPVRDAAGNIIAVWANFADFKLVEDIVSEMQREYTKATHTESMIFLVDAKGNLLADYNSTETSHPAYERAENVGRNNIADAGYMPAKHLVEGTAGEDGINILPANDVLDGVEDLTGWAKSTGAYDYTGLGWGTIVGQPTAELYAENNDKLKTITLIVGGLISAIIFFGWLIGNRAARPVKGLSRTVSRLSDGDYSATVHVDPRGDEIGDMMRALHSNVAKINNVLIKIKESAEQVHVAAKEISSGSTDLAARTEQQAAALEETSAAMEQITGTVKSNSENATNASNLTQETREIANAGGQLVDDVVQAMGNIETSSQRISDIIGVIDEIAFQTNLLALNAAVEAARAGEAGKGFAVVASEVRVLAGRSSAASKEIKTLIQDSSNQVKNGSNLVQQAGKTLKEIVGSVNHITELMTEIAAAGREQASGIEQVNQAITNMDESTQQNAALVEENTAAAGALVQQANTLAELIGFFVTGTDSESGDNYGNAGALPSRGHSGHGNTKSVAALQKSTSYAEDDWKEF